MPQSLAQIYLHVVFSTKQRRRILTEDVRERMNDYLGGICRGLKSPPIRIGGTDDHVHVLCRLTATIRPCDFVRDVKKDSSVWIKTIGAQFKDFHWQDGYGAFSVSPSHVDALVSYIENQEKHHKTETFQEEFRRLCKKYGLEIDERYVWD